MIAVTFTRASGIYNGGETAAFDAATADRLVKAGVATLPAAAQPAEPQPPNPLASLKLDELKALAADEGIHLGEAKTKAEIAEVIDAARLAKADAPAADA